MPRPGEPRGSATFIIYFSDIIAANSLKYRELRLSPDPAAQGGPARVRLMDIIRCCIAVYEDRRGAAGLEYGLIAAVIAVAVFAMAAAIGPAEKRLLSEISVDLCRAINSRFCVQPG